MRRQRSICKLIIISMLFGVVSGECQQKYFAEEIPAEKASSLNFYFTSKGITSPTECAVFCAKRQFCRTAILNRVARTCSLSYDWRINCRSRSERYESFAPSANQHFILIACVDTCKAEPSTSGSTHVKITFADNPTSPSDPLWTNKQSNPESNLNPTTPISPTDPSKESSEWKRILSNDGKSDSTSSASRHPYVYRVVLNRFDGGPSKPADQPSDDTDLTSTRPYPTISQISPKRSLSSVPKMAETNSKKDEAPNKLSTSVVAFKKPYAQRFKGKWFGEAEDRTGERPFPALAWNKPKNLKEGGGYLNRLLIEGVHGGDLQTAGDATAETVHDGVADSVKGSRSEISGCFGMVNGQFLLHADYQMYTNVSSDECRCLCAETWLSPWSTRKCKSLQYNSMGECLLNKDDHHGKFDLVYDPTAEYHYINCSQPAFSAGSLANCPKRMSETTAEPRLVTQFRHSFMAALRNKTSSETNDKEKSDTEPESKPANSVITDKNGKKPALITAETVKSVDTAESSTRKTIISNGRIGSSKSIKAITQSSLSSNGDLGQESMITPIIPLLTTLEPASTAKTIESGRLSTSSTEDTTVSPEWTTASPSRSGFTDSGSGSTDSGSGFTDSRSGFTDMFPSPGSLSDISGGRTVGSTITTSGSMSSIEKGSQSTTVKFATSVTSDGSVTSKSSFDTTVESGTSGSSRMIGTGVTTSPTGHQEQSDGISTSTTSSDRIKDESTTVITPKVDEDHTTLESQASSFVTAAESTTTMNMSTEDGSESEEDSQEIPEAETNDSGTESTKNPSAKNASETSATSTESPSTTIQPLITVVNSATDERNVTEGRSATNGHRATATPIPETEGDDDYDGTDGDTSSQSDEKSAELTTRRYGKNDLTGTSNRSSEDAAQATGNSSIVVINATGIPESATSSPGSCYEILNGRVLKSTAGGLRSGVSLEECQCHCATSNWVNISTEKKRTLELRKRELRKRGCAGLQYDQFRTSGRYSFQCGSATYYHKERDCVLNVDNTWVHSAAFDEQFLKPLANVSYISMLCSPEEAIQRLPAAARDNECHISKSSKHLTTTTLRPTSTASGNNTDKCFLEMPGHVLEGTALAVEVNTTIEECKCYCINADARYGTHCQSLQYYFQSRTCLINRENRCGINIYFFQSRTCLINRENRLSSMERFNSARSATVEQSYFDFQCATDQSVLSMYEVEVCSTIVGLKPKKKVTKESASSEKRGLGSRPLGNNDIFQDEMRIKPKKLAESEVFDKQIESGTSTEPTSTTQLTTTTVTESSTLTLSSSSSPTLSTTATPTSTTSFNPWKVEMPPEAEESYYDAEEAHDDPDQARTAFVTGSASPLSDANKDIQPTTTSSSLVTESASSPETSSNSSSNETRYAPKSAKTPKVTTSTQPATTTSTYTPAGPCTYSAIYQMSFKGNKLIKKILVSSPAQCFSGCYHENCRSANLVRVSGLLKECELFRDSLIDYRTPNVLSFDSNSVYFDGIHCGRIAS